jgi:hypothetical protein
MVSIREEITQCKRQIAQYRAALDAGTDPAIVGQWIIETQARKLAAEGRLRTRIGTRPVSPGHMSKEEITAIVNAITSLITVLRDADLHDKAEIYSQLGLRLTYNPSPRTVSARAEPGRPCTKGSCPRGTRRLRTCLRSSVSWSLGAGRERAGRRVDRMADHRVRGGAGGDRGHGLLPAHAPTGRRARAARVGGGPDAAVGGRHDRGSLDGFAGQLSLRWTVRALNGTRVGDGCFLATGAALFPGSVVGTCTEVRIHGVVHVNTVLPPGEVAPIGWVAVGDPAQTFPPGQHEQIWAIQESLDFPCTVYGVDRDTPATERMSRQAAWYASHLGDRQL